VSAWSDDLGTKTRVEIERRLAKISNESP